MQTISADQLPLGRSDAKLAGQRWRRPVSTDWTWRRALGRRIFAAGLALLLGGLILALAVPRMLASAFLVLRAPVLQRMDAGERFSDADLLGLIASRELALEWVADSNAHDQRARALAELAFRGGRRSAAEKTMLAGAVEATGAGLALAPADPKDWMQLGYLLVLLEDDPNRSAAEALLMSMRTGPFQAPNFLRRRLFWSLAHLAFYDAAERRQIDDQIRLMWRVAPGALADLALDVPHSFAPITSALEQMPGARDRFLSAVAFASPFSAAP